MHMILRNIWARNWVPTLYQGQSILSRNFKMCVILKGLCIWASYLYMPRNFNMTGTGLELARCYQYLAASSPELVQMGDGSPITSCSANLFLLYTVVTMNAFFGPVAGVVHRIPP